MVCNYMVTKKTRKGSGWRTPKVVKPGMKWSEFKEQVMEPQPVYDDWLDYRDGMRDWPSIDRKKREIEKEKRKQKISATSANAERLIKRDNI